jgi:transcriptional regulator with XRE-family HTH domain
LTERTADRSVLQAWGTTIRRYRQWKRLTRRDLASRAGLSPVFLGEIERGEKDPSSHSLTLLAGALEVPLAELYLRVAMLLDTAAPDDREVQGALPLGVREAGGDYLDSVPLAQDETAFDLYKIARLLRSDQQVSLLVLARSLAGARQ